MILLYIRITKETVGQVCAKGSAKKKMNMSVAILYQIGFQVLVFLVGTEIVFCFTMAAVIRGNDA